MLYKTVYWFTFDSAGLIIQKKEVVIFKKIEQKLKYNSFKNLLHTTQQGHWTNSSQEEMDHPVLKTAQTLFFVMSVVFYKSEETD